MHERPCHRLDLPKLPTQLQRCPGSPTPHSSNVFPCHNGSFAIGLANILKPRKRMSCVATFAAHSNSFVLNDMTRYPSVFAELAQKSRQTLVAKMSSSTGLTVAPFFKILNSWFSLSAATNNCFVHTRKHPPHFERLVFVQTCNINVRLSSAHHNVLFLLQRVQHVKYGMNHQHALPSRLHDSALCKSKQPHRV